MKEQKTTMIKKHNWNWRTCGLAYLFLAPALILLGVYLIYPTVRALILSFQKWRGIGAAGG